MNSCGPLLKGIVERADLNRRPAEATVGPNSQFLKQVTQLLRRRLICQVSIRSGLSGHGSSSGPRPISVRAIHPCPPRRGRFFS